MDSSAVREMVEEDEECRVILEAARQVLARLLDNAPNRREARSKPPRQPRPPSARQV